MMAGEIIQVVFGKNEDVYTVELVYQETRMMEELLSELVLHTLEDRSLAN